MPPRSVTITMRDQAQATIKRAASALSERFGVTLEGSSTYDGRDPDYLRAKELERIATFLDGLANAETPELAALDAAHAEVDELTAACDAYAAALASWAEFGETVQLLLWAAVENDVLRTALVEAGFIEAEFAETTGWAVSVVGIGPKLAEMIERNKPVSDPAPQLDDDGNEPPVDLSSKKLDELKAIAATMGIDGADKFRSKADAIAAIEAAS